MAIANPGLHGNFNKTCRRLPRPRYYTVAVRFSGRTAQRSRPDGPTVSLHRDGALFDGPRQAGTRAFGLFAGFRTRRPCPGVATLATNPPADGHERRKNRGSARARIRRPRFRREALTDRRNAGQFGSGPARPGPTALKPRLT